MGFPILLEDGGSLLLEDGYPLLLEFWSVDEPTDTGGVFCRLTDYDNRTFERSQTDRVYGKVVLYSSRIWSSLVNQAVRTLYCGDGESRTFGFDFSLEGEVKDGATLSSPVVPAVAGLTIGTPVVLSADFNEGGTVKKKIPSGKGVKVRMSGSPGTYNVVCSVVTSTGDTLTIPGKLIVTDN